MIFFFFFFSSVCRLNNMLSRVQCYTALWGKSGWGVDNFFFLFLGVCQNRHQCTA